MFCQQCGNTIPEDSVFCPECGAKVQAQEPLEEEKTIGLVYTPAPVEPASAYEPPVAEPTPTPIYEAPVAQPVSTPSYEAPVYAPVAEPVPVYPPYTQPVFTVEPPNKTPHNGFVNPIKAIGLFFKNYVNFKGRASRSELWWMLLFNCIVTFIGAYAYPVLFAYWLATLIPGLALTTRRLHDTGKKFPFIFMGLIPAAGVFIVGIRLLFVGSEGNNQWGLSPNYDAQGAATTQAKYQDSVNYAPAQPVQPQPTPPEPTPVETISTKEQFDQALAQIVPNYNGTQMPSTAMMVCDPNAIKQTIANTDTQTLLVIVQALDYYLAQGDNPTVLGIVKTSALETINNR